MRFIGTSDRFFTPDGVGSGAVPAAPGGGVGETSSPSSAAPSGVSLTPTTPSNDAGTPPPASGGEGGPSPGTPSPPSPTTPTPIETSFAGLEFADDDEGNFGLEPTLAPVAPVAPAVAAPVVPPAAVPPVQPAAAAPTTQVAAQAPGQQGDAAVPSPAEPAQIAAAMLANESAFVDHLAATDFALSAEDLAALETDAPAHIPKLLSRLYVKSQMAALNQMQRIVPAMLQAQTKIMARNAANEGKFYARWPEIAKDQHGERVSQLARTYRQMNPATSLDQMIEDLGPIVMMTAKIAPGSAQPRPQAAAPGSRIAPRPAPSPFRPAGTSAASGVAPQPGTDANPWIGLAGATDDE